MKKFSIAAVAALTLTAAAPAFADTKVSDDPFVATKGNMGFDPSMIAVAATGLAVIAAAAAGDS